MNRRNFLKTSGGAFFVAAAGKAIGAGAPSNRIRLCVMGCSRTAFDGTRYSMNPKGARGRGYQVMCRVCEMKDAEIAAVCDVDAAARAYAAAEVKRIGGNGPRQFNDIRDVLKDPDIDGVIVATPDHWHVLAGIWTMQAGKALYLEKPIGVTAGEAEVLAAVQRQTGRVFQLGTQRRSSFATQQAVAAIRAGQVGKPHWAKAWCLSDRPAIRPAKNVEIPEGLDWDLWQGPAPRRTFKPELVHYNWRFFRGYGTGDLPNNGLHFVDIARWALGADYPTRVYAGGGKLFHEGEDFEFEDTHMLTAQFADGKYLTWEGCSHTGAMPFMGKWTGCLVYCDDGLAFFGAMGESALYDRKGKKVIREWAAGDTDPSAQEGDNRLSNPLQTCDQAHMRRFVNCVRAKSQATAMPIDEALKSNIITELGNVSLLTGNAVHLDPSTGKLADPSSPAAAFWTRTYEPGWEVKA